MTETAAALHWTAETCMSAALELYADSLVELSDGAERITVRVDGIAYKEGLKREKEMVWVCPWCRKQDNQRNAHAAPHGTGKCLSNSPGKSAPYLTFGRNSVR